ncbi:hypothetical protein Tco_0998736 [Tanacetum coccineum]
MSDGYASIVDSEQRAELFGRIGTLERDNMRHRGVLGVERQRVDHPAYRNKEYEEHLRRIFKLLKNKELYAKCEFWLSKVQFLVHVVDSQGIHGDSTKIKSIKD